MAQLGWTIGFGVLLVALDQVAGFEATVIGALASILAYAFRNDQSK